MKYLVTGGLGYIGSHMVNKLVKNNHHVVIIDKSQKKKFTKFKNTKLARIDLLDLKKLDREINKQYFDGVFHFAGLSILNDSHKFKKKYYLNNVVATKNLINTMIKYNLNNLIFSSSASVYGNPKHKNISENSVTDPISNYGRNKLDIEKFLLNKSKENNFKSISFRYFNAAGADEKSKIGEDHRPETHIIPKILKLIKNKKKKVFIYGNDYPTKDGTCIRDYIHVNDIVDAHYLGLKKFKSKKKFFIYNIGNEKGYSVLDIIKVIEKVTNKKLIITYKKRRKGDPSVLVANSKKLKKELNWAPRYRNIYDIIKTAWNWHKN